MSRCSRPDCCWQVRSIRPICIASSRAGPAPDGSTSFGVGCTRWRRPGESGRRIPFSWRIGWSPARTSAVCRHWPSRTRSRNTSRKLPVSRPAGRTSAARPSAGSRSVTSNPVCSSAVVTSTSDRASTPSSSAPEKALLDLVHLHPGGDDEAYLRELRLDLDALQLDVLGAFAETAAIPKLARAAERIRRLAREAPAYESL